MRTTLVTAEARWLYASKPMPLLFRRPPYSSEYGSQLNLAVVRANGSFWWDIGNLAGSDEALASDIVLTYGRTYHFGGWTISPTFEGTRFTNDGTGHGMFVSVDNVYAF
jgi:hypothetical protein